MRHLILCREYPPAPYLPGGIGTYVANIAGLLAEAGESVTVIGHRWPGAPLEHEVRCDGRLVVRRVPTDAPVSFESPCQRRASTADEIKLFRESAFPHQAFSWNAALLAETLIETEGVDVVEGQEWEAPLYYLLLRRALGLGPERRPPCFVHLHSPTMMIVRHNEWSLANQKYLAMVRNEEYVIRSADALLCPSQYLASQVAAAYSLDRESIRVLPYPAGDVSVVERAADVWNSHRLVYVGRLEPRKGLIEWIDAAVDIAHETPTARFDLIGGDVPYRGGESVAEYLHHRIPAVLRPRFVFHGVLPRAELPALLGGARAAIVPGRWENFPYSCIEAMCSGLPVVASPNGGMIEMVRDGETGWIASSASSNDLADAMRRAISTDADVCARMGRSAAASIRRLCDNVAIAAQHIAFRQALAATGPSRSCQLPAALWTDRTSSFGPRGAVRGGARQTGRIGILVDAMDDIDGAEATVAAVLARETCGPDCAIIVGQTTPSVPVLQRAEASGWRIVLAGQATRMNAIRDTASAILSSASVAGIALLPAAVVPVPHFAKTIATILDECPSVGAVSPWVADLPATAGPCPAFPYAWVLDDASPATVFRREAFLGARWLGEEASPGLLRWMLTVALLAEGWTIVTLPALLAGVHAPRQTPRISSTREMDVRRLVRTFYGPLVARCGDEIVSLLEQGVGILSDDGWPRRSSSDAYASTAETDRQRLSVREIVEMPTREKIHLAARGVRHPVRAASWVGSKARRLGRRFGIW